MSADFDQAIDGAVRELLDVEPRANLGTRVTRRIDRRTGGSRAVRVAWWTAVAAAAVILLAVFVARRSEPVAPQAPVIAHASDARLPAVVAPTAAEPVSAVPSPIRVVRNTDTTTPDRVRASVAATSVASDAPVAVADIAPLKRIAPIAIAPITSDDIAPADISVHALEPITELQIAPLTPPDRRN